MAAEACRAIDRGVFAAFAAAEETHWWFVGRRAILRRLVDAVSPVREGRTVMDIGCGVGSTLAAFDAGDRCIGYDPSADAIGFARERYPRFELRVGAAADATAAIPAADVVLLNDVIEHVEDDRGLLATVVGPMKRGAVLVVTVPADMKLWSPHDERMGHFRRYDRAMLESAAEGLPVRALLVSHFMSRLYPVVRAVRRVSRWRGRAAGVSGIDLWTPPRLPNALLARLFAGEAGRLVRAEQGSASPYRRGVSLVAVFRRD